MRVGRNLLIQKIKYEVQKKRAEINPNLSVSKINILDSTTL